MKKVALIVALLVAPVVSKADQFVICVQEQLLSQGMQIGAADGWIGSRTRSAVAELKAVEPALSDLPSFDISSASVWCREIGKLFDAKQFWPSRDQQIVIDAVGLHPSKIEMVEKLSADALRFLKDQFDTEIAGTLIVTAASTMPDLVEQTATHLRKANQQDRVENQMKRQCADAKYISGASYGGVVAMCPSPKFTTKAEWSALDVHMLKRMISHEFTHEFQSQLVGNYRLYGSLRQEAERGPKWLVEGLAIAIELEFGVQSKTVETQVAWFEKQQSYDGETLRAYSKQNTAGTMQFQLNAGYAGVLLASRHGLKSFANFWENTPRMGWEAAFEHAFGQSVESFYTNFGA